MGFRYRARTVGPRSTNTYNFSPYNQKGFVMSNQETSPREIRRTLGLNQSDFWKRLGVTQSGGSRYESGQKIPKAVHELLNIIYARGIDTEKLVHDDFSVMSYLKTREPLLYELLKTASRKSAGAIKDSQLVSCI